MPKNKERFVRKVRFVEVSHAIEAGMETYPGLPVPQVEVLMDHESSRAKYNDQSEFLIASLHLCGNTGTYVDSPRHRYPQGIDLSCLPLESLAHLPTLVVDASASIERGIGVAAFRGLRLRDHAVLVHTGWSRHWRTPAYFEDNPFLTAEACDLLVDAGARFVGIDSLNIDDIHDLSRPAHTKLLGANVPICEHMTNLDAVPAGNAFLHAVPIAWVGGATFPVRGYVVVEE
jgi:kynurenine formamidase